MTDTRVAPTAAERQGRVMARPASPRLRWAVDRVDPRAGERVLEIGCGPGVAADLVCAVIGDGSYVGLDRSAAAIAAAERRTAEHRARGTATFLRDDVATAALPSGAFDLVFAVRVARVANADGDILERIAGWLAPGGRLAVIHDRPGSDAAAFADALGARFRRAGWSVLGVEYGAPAEGGMSCVVATPT